MLAQSEQQLTWHSEFSFHWDARAQRVGKKARRCEMIISPQSRGKRAKESGRVRVHQTPQKLGTTRVAREMWRPRNERQNGPSFASPVTKTTLFLSIFFFARVRNLNFSRQKVNFARFVKEKKKWREEKKMRGSIYWDSVDSQQSSASSGDHRNYVDPWDLENYAYLRRRSVYQAPSRMGRSARTEPVDYG